MIASPAKSISAKKLSCSTCSTAIVIVIVIIVWFVTCYFLEKRYVAIQLTFAK